MCEPAHSIVQFDPPDDDNDDQNSGTPTGRLGMFVGNIGKWFKKIGGMFHVSMMGAGHSETLSSISAEKQAFLLPPDTKYEAKWWNRSFVLDSDYRGRNVTLDRFGRFVPIHSDPVRKQLAYENAKQYADLVSIGSLHSLRQFLGATIDKADNLGLYNAAFRQILTPKGRCHYENRLKQADLLETNLNKIEKLDNVREAFKRICLGLTRARRLLVPEWADDKTLWVPPTRKLVMAKA